VNPAVEGYTAAVLESVGPEDSGSLAQELAAIVRLVEDHNELRSALTDTAVAAASRRAVVSELLEHRVSDPARRLAAFTVAAVRAPDVPAALGWVARRAADRQLDLATLGHQAARQRVGGFAAAVFETTTETSDLEEIEDQLFRFARIVESNRALRSTLSDRDVPAQARTALVDQLLDGKVEPATLRLIRFVVTGGRARDFVGALDWLVEQTATARGWRVARVQSAEPIADAQRELLAAALSGITGTPVELQVTIDSELIGGAVIEIGDLHVDASARGRLDRLREELLPVGSTGTGDRNDRARGDQ
jgi:F-type H+-transporting ATPase subunit delta